MQVVLFQDLAQLAQVLNDQVGLRCAQLFECVVASQDGARVNAPVLGGFNVMLHVPDKERLVGLKLVLFEDFMDLFPFIPNTQIRFFNVRAEGGYLGLHGEMVVMDRA